VDLSKTIAQYIAATTYEDLPEDVIHFTKLCILDYFGSAFAGSSKPPIKMIEAFVREMGGEEQATLVTGGKTSVMNAALVNGAASHIVELDDIHKSSIIHAATVVIPAALAIAEWKRLSGKDLITAVVIGYEVCYRIGEAVSPSHYYYWHNTATCGTFGAAAATAKLFDLTVEEMIHSLGNAGTQAAGLWEFIEDGAMTKQLHPGKAAMNGVMSTMLAKKGFTGAQRILEGNRGFFEAMSEQYDASKITAGLGEEFKIMENSFKVHASCRHTHHAMDLMVELANGRTLSLKDIDQITVKTYQVAINITDNDEPDTVYAAKFSLQYCVALALLTGQGDLDAFSEKALWNDDIRSLMKKIDVQVDQTIDQMYPEKWGAEVEILLNSGETMLTETDFPKGDPENAVTADDLMQKYMKLAKKLPEAERRSFADKVMELESITNVEELMESIEIYKFM
jgi:2-methylcitrate dehydratase PrpD